MNKRRLNVSPSQVKKFETCPRLTAWQLCTKVKPPPGPPDSRALGERAHALVERWLLEGERPDPTETIVVWRKPTKLEAVALSLSAHNSHTFSDLEGERHAARFGSEWRVQDRAYVGAIALAHLQTVPPPKHPGLEVEVSATVTTPAATYKARADYRARAFGVSTIGDHKFVGDLSYALTNRPGSVNGFGEPNYLGDDVQATFRRKRSSKRTRSFQRSPSLGTTRKRRRLAANTQRALCASPSPASKSIARWRRSIRSPRRSGPFSTCRSTPTRYHLDSPQAEDAIASMAARASTSRTATSHTKKGKIST